MMSHRLIAAFVAVVLVPALVGAEEKAAAKKPSGTYTRESGDHKLAFTFKGDKLTVRLTRGDTVITIDAAYGVTKDGVLFASMTNVEAKNADNTPTKGELFGFQFDVSKADEMTISDLKGTHINDEARRLVEGVYKKDK